MGGLQAQPQDLRQAGLSRPGQTAEEDEDATAGGGEVKEALWDKVFMRDSGLKKGEKDSLY